MTKLPQPPEIPLARGRLLDHYRRSLSVGSAALGRPVIAELLPGVSGEAEASSIVLGGKATLVTGANITGLWHYSGARIERFTRERAEEGRAGKFGHGTYFGVGEIKGETVDGLISSGSVRHQAGFVGNILALDRARVRDVAADLRTLGNVPQPSYKSTIQNGPITDLVEGLRFDGCGVDAVMVYMDPERRGAELIVLPRATESISITGA